MSTTAPIVEIFSSFQGEGPHIGEKHTFIRFQDCQLSCQYCDSPQSFIENPHCRSENPPGSRKFDFQKNPLSVEDLNQILSRFHDPVLSVTGGEPLQKADFLRAWLPSVRNKKILLETAGIHAPELKSILHWINIVSMDIKLPSSTGMKAYWEEHQDFLSACVGKEVYVKAVVTGGTLSEDIQRARDLVFQIDPSIPFILQPVSAFGSFRKIPSKEQLNEWQGLAAQSLSHVRVIPQMHKQLGVL